MFMKHINNTNYDIDDQECLFGKKQSNKYVPSDFDNIINVDNIPLFRKDCT